MSLLIRKNFPSSQLDLKLLLQENVSLAQKDVLSVFLAPTNVKLVTSITVREQEESASGFINLKGVSWEMGLFRTDSTQMEHCVIVSDPG